MREIAVILPAYRARKTLARALASVASERIETIVVQDGDTDELEDIVASFIGVRLIRLPQNGGAAAARNVGLASTTAEYVFFLDADDFVSPGLMEDLAAAARAAHSDLAFSPWTFVYDGVPRSKVKYPHETRSDRVFAAWLRNDCVPTCAVLWRADSLRKIGGWDPGFRFADDTELMLRATMSGVSITTIDRGCGYYVQHDGPGRLSRSSVPVVMDAMEKIYARISPWVSARQDADLTAALSENCYEQSRRAYRAGLQADGARWLERSRALGLSGHVGSFPHRIASRLLGLRAKERLASLRDRVPFMRHRFD